jgi:hypothetical protein
LSKSDVLGFISDFELSVRRSSTGNMQKLT